MQHGSLLVGGIGWTIAAIALVIASGCDVDPEGQGLSAGQCDTDCGEPDPDATPGGDAGEGDTGSTADDDGDEGPDGGADDDRGDDGDGRPSGDGGDEPPDNDPDGRAEDIDPSDPACCGQRHQVCLDAGGSSAQCDGLLEICEGGSCDELTALCDATSIPVSASCARAYHACFGIRINKCKRTGYNQCVNRLGDVELCAAWDASCEERFAVCAERFDCEYHSPGNEGEEGNQDEQVDQSTCNPPNMYYECTDWGHELEPCWPAYEACSGSSDECLAELKSCMNDIDGDLNNSCEGHGTTEPESVPDNDEPDDEPPPG